MDDITFARPEFLYAAIGAILLILLLGAILGKRSGSRLRRSIATLLRAAVVGLLLVAAAGPFRPLMTIESRETLVLADDSGSISDAGRAELEGALDTLRGEGPTAELVFGNEQGTENEFLFQDGAARAVAVHSQAILETLTSVYEAPALAAELTGKDGSD